MKKIIRQDKNCSSVFFRNIILNPFECLSFFMLKYVCVYPLNEVVIDDYHYKYLLRDSSSPVPRTLSENITWFNIGDAFYEQTEKTVNEILLKMESAAKEFCDSLQVAYSESSGNRWVFLLYDGNPTKDGLRQMQKAYEELFDPNFKRWRS